MLCWSKSSEFDFLVNKKRVERGRDVVTKEGREEEGGGAAGAAEKKHSGNKDPSNTWKVFYRVAASRME